MIIISDFKKWAEKCRAQGQLISSIEDLSIQVYANSPLQLNITLPSQQGAIFKLTERQPGLFIVAMAPSAGKSIDYTAAKLFRATSPLENLRQAFSNENISHIVDVLQRH